MQNKQPGWDDLRVLLAVHRGGSFLAAGLELGVSTSTVARRVSTLEAELGRVLVHRTSQGTLLDAETLQLVLLAEKFEQALATHRRDARAPYAGVVRVSVPDGLARVVAEAAIRFARRHPETSVEVVSEARFVDLVKREADLGIRARASSSPVLVDRALGDVHSGLFASDAYLRQRLPQRALYEGQWGLHDFIVDDGVNTPTQWLIERGARRFSFRANTVDARVHAARGGLGLVLLAMSDRTRQEGLHHVELDAPLPALPFFLTMHKDLRKVPRVRAFAAVLFEVLRATAT